MTQRLTLRGLTEFVCAKNLKSESRFKNSMRKGSQLRVLSNRAILCFTAMAVKWLRQMPGVEPKGSKLQKACGLNYPSAGWQVFTSSNS